MVWDNHEKEPEIENAPISNTCDYSHGAIVACVSGACDLHTAKVFGESGSTHNGSLGASK